MIYPILLGAGFVGLVAMMLLGFVHAPGAHRAGHHHGQLHGGGHSAPQLGRGPGGGHALVRAPAHGPVHAVARAPAVGGARVPANATGEPQLPAEPGLANAANISLTWIAPLLSPMHWFSWMIGAGAAGWIAQLAGAGTVVAAVSAVMGATAFQRLVLQPIWNFVFGFETKPAGNLDSCLMQEVEVVTSFNGKGEGLVRVEFDGRTEDILARLIEADGTPESRPKRGDRLVIEEVDPKRNTCRVSRIRY